MDILERADDDQIPEQALCHLVRTGILETKCIAVRNSSRALWVLQKHSEGRLEPELLALTATNRACQFDENHVAKDRYVF